MINLLITGTVRNVGNSILKRVLKLEKNLKSAFDTKWLIIESDSEDDTIVELLKLKQLVSNFEFISLGRLQEKIPLRTQRLAYCRNLYLQKLKESPKYENIDYVMVIDLDEVGDQLTQESISSCFERSDWDVCCACQNGPYYDIWALRHYLWSPNDCWKSYQFLINHGSSRYTALTSAVYSRMLNISKCKDWIEVDSAFGGCAIYKKHILLDVLYCGTNENNEEVCEHVELHRQIKQKGGRIFINPRFINARVIEHSIYATHLGLVRLWLKDFIKSVMALFSGRF
ncbi:hypothetical protein [Thermosynechococcus sp. PKX82]|uniref:hypothetical protein n=1 Tax=Thermosynechococcus sp. PKX82 TaxID=3074086 RepID=UPI0028738149|nr:hypothetical protein [Thermosynechococcus sp. PKX82]WNC30106.1 hypothetical protein RHH53_00705 [Thermosynechococcus sp. PKX82]